MLKVADAFDSKNPVVIILDGLDGCYSKKSRVRAEFFTALWERLGDVPLFVRFLITSRQESDIKRALRYACEMDMCNAKDVDKDIATLFRKVLGDNRSTDEKIQLLVTCTAGHFLWASTACNFARDDPAGRLELLLCQAISNDEKTALYGLYAFIQETIGRWDDDHFVDSFQRVIGTIIASPVPLTIPVIDVLASASSIPVDTSSIIQPFRCVIAEDGVNKPPTVRIVHSSLH